MLRRYIEDAGERGVHDITVFSKQFIFLVQFRNRHKSDNDYCIIIPK